MNIKVIVFKAPICPPIFIIKKTSRAGIPINKRINEDLADLAEAKSQKFEIINIISNFQPIGNEVNEIIENKAFQLSCLFALLTILILLLFKLNIYLEDYKK